MPAREPTVRESIQNLPTELRERVLAVERRCVRLHSLLDIGRALADPKFEAWYLERLHSPADGHPVLLLPLRIEARVDAQNALLKVRVLPDAIAIDRHADTLLGEPLQIAGEDAWNSLSTEFGPTRAAWIWRACEAGPASLGSASSGRSGVPLHFDGRLIPHTVTLTEPGSRSSFENAAVDQGLFPGPSRQTRRLLARLLTPGQTEVGSAKEGSDPPRLRPECPSV